MKSTGIVRQIDNLGRIVIPKELRKTLNIEPWDDIEIYTEDDMIVLSKYKKHCVFCGDAENIVIYKEKHICSSCLNELKNNLN